MRTLSSTLLEAQKRPFNKPVIKLEVQEYGHPQTSSSPVWGGGLFNWTKLYGGTEAQSWHGSSISGAGTLHRVRLQGTTIYYSRVTSPGPGSNFSSWTNFGSVPSSPQGRVAIGAVGNNIIIVSMDAGYLYRRESTDDGATWGNWTAMTNARPCERGVAVAFKPNGDCAIVHASDVNDPLSLYIQKRTGGSWSTGLGQRTGDYYVQALAMYYDGDWNIIALVTEGSYLTVQRMVYGDGYRQTAGAWATDVKIGLGRARLDIRGQVQQRTFDRQQRGSAEARRMPTYWEVNQAVLEVLVGEAPDVTGPFLCQPSNYPALLCLTRAGVPYVFRLQPGTDFFDRNWSRAHTIPTYAQYGMSICADSQYLWATQANEVWRAPMPSTWSPPAAGSGAGTKFTITMPQMVRLQASQREQGSRLEVEIDNSRGDWDSPPSQLKHGSRVNLFIGYNTPQGQEYQEVARYFIEGYGYKRDSDRREALLTIQAVDIWGLLEGYQFDRPVEWNIGSNDYTAYELISLVLQAVGGSLTYKSRSSLVTSLYPRLTIRPGQTAAQVLRRLLNLVPDRLRSFGLEAVMVYPQAGDGVDYEYTLD
jgi:hypothetical protein